ncbi:MAG: acetate--CoA ligase family protein [Burkholderiales bacterium]|nr:acetate--CoA ligase family protein [Burkholderiales bacterium]
MSARALYDRQALAPLLAPRSVAIVGISPRPNSFGMRTLENLAHYRGAVYLVNPKYERIGDRPCHPSVAALPEKPDCAVLVLPREAVEPALEEAAAAGARSAIVYASGYGEMGREEAARAEARLAAIARAARMPVLGPNCMGMVNHALRCGLTFIPEYSRARPGGGPIAVVSQSGALGYSLAQAWERGAGIGWFFSAGNSADIDVADLVAAFAEEPQCRAIALLFEGVRSAARMLEAGERARRAGKPVVVLKLGTSADGAAAARSHTGSLAGSAVAWRALFERAGFVAVEDYEALLERTKFFAVAGAPRARGVAVVSGSGGAGVIAADKAAEHGVPMPQPSAETVQALRAILPEFGAARNPCDPTGQVLSDPESLGRCCRALLADSRYGALVLSMTVASHEIAEARLQLLRELAAEQPKPVALVWMSEWLQGPGIEGYEALERVPLFRSAGRCFATIAAWHAYHERARGPQAPRGRLSDEGARERARGLLAAAGETLTEREAKKVLACYGVPVVEERLASSAEEAATAARSLGYPVALKVESPAIPHKTEAGVVRLGIADGAALARAYAEVLAAAHRVARAEDIRGVLVQPMASGVEMLVGARVDPVVGPVIVVGAGGVLVELVEDTAAALAPVSPEEALAMLRRLRSFRLLEGFRGAPRANVEQLAEAVARISEFVADHAGEIAEVDVNPIVCASDRVLAVDALIVRCRKG